jgi:predicted phage tail protein
MIEGAVIAGGGGGKSGGSGGGLSESEDTLKSTAYAQVLDLVCEGEIGGLVNGAKSIYLDDVPLQNTDNSYNFSGVTYISTTGTQTQPAIAGFNQVESEIAVGIEAKISTGPVVRNISTTNITSIIVTVQIPGLTFMDSKGALGGTTVEYAIDVQVDGGGWVEKTLESLTGKSSQAYERQYRINLPTGTTRQFRLRRITADSTNSQLNNKTVLKSFTEVIDAKLRYPNSALVGLKVDASQFRSVPRRGYDMKLLKIRIPTNATVRADGSLAYSGTWDGSFQVAWSCCPAWAYYDLVTMDRYGLGDYIDASQVDKWSLYSISRYSNELISNGFGGTEPRFSCNVWINSRQEAYTVLNQMTSIFRGMSYWASGSISAVQDAPKDPVYLYTNANVIDGTFSYQGSSAKSRHTVALVTWNDPADQYRQKIEYVEDTAGIARYGVIESEIVAVGCTSRGQAARVGRWMLYTEKFETGVVGFKTGSEGAMCAPGDIVKIADQYRAGVRIGGRISSATTTSVTVDSLATAPTGTLTLSIVAPDGTVQTRSGVTVVGKVVSFTPALSVAPNTQSQWILTGTNIDVPTYRVMTVTENDEGEYEITALEHDANKYAYIENLPNFATRNYTDLSPVPATPTGLTVTENVYAFQNTTRARVFVQWAASDFATAYIIGWRVNSDNFTEVTVTTNSFELLDTIVGTYDFRVISLNSAGRSSGTYASASLTTVGNSAPPAAPTVTATAVPGGVKLDWTPAGDAIWQAQVWENTTNNSATATLLATLSATSYTRTGLLAVNGIRYFWVKILNTQGVASAFSSVQSATALAVSTGLNLTNEAVALPAASDGTVSSFSGATGQATFFDGTTDVTASTTFSAVAVGCTGTINTAVGTPVAGQPKGYYQVTAMSADAATLTISAVYGSQTFIKVFNLTKAKAGTNGTIGADGAPGADGTPAITGYLTSEAVQLFAYANGGIVSYAPATGSFKVFSGNTDVSASFALSTLTNPQALTVGYVGQTYSVTAGFDATEDTASLTIRATGSGTYTGVTIDKVFSLSKAKGGYEIVATLPTTNLFEGRVVFLTTDDKLYRYTGSAWTAAVPAVDISGTLADAQIAALAASKITGQLSDSQLAAIAAAKLTGQITGTQITDGAISTAKLMAGSVTSNEIAANTIVAADIASGTITATQIAAATITGANIAAGTIAAGNIAANTITASQIAANTITATQIASNAITADEIAAGAVTAAKIGVTQLSAITATIGTLETATTGARVQIKDNIIKVFDPTRVRVKIGDLSL